MKLILVASVVWIKSDFGGRSNKPVVGLRPTIRFQRYVADWISTAWDVEIIDIDIDQNTWSGKVKMRFTRNLSPKQEWLNNDELIELLDGYRVIAVGKIIEIITK
jgi:hypothetical protein